jgi:hypothetical protein
MEVHRVDQRPENLLRYNVIAGKIPSREDVAQSKHWTDDPALKAFVDALNVAKPRAYGPKYPRSPRRSRTCCRAR